MFDFLFSKTSRKEKNIILKEIIERISADEYNKMLYLTSIEILDDTEFDNFYITLTESITNIKTENSFLKKEVELPGISSF